MAENNNWMLEDKEKEFVANRARALSITGTPDQASHNLGPIKLGNGKTVTAHVVHAVDAVITDGTYIVLIKRKNPPGKGMAALPGGFMDPTKSGIESAVNAAAREAAEEVGVELDTKHARPVGTRNMHRPHDVRIATADLPQYGIKQGDVFMVSTQAVRFDVPDLSKLILKAGDDAAHAYIARIDSLKRETMGIPDHYDMIVEAMKMDAARPATLPATSKPGQTSPK